MKSKDLPDARPRMAALATQARADVRACSATDLSPCQKRYLLHQACEKASKAILLSYRDAHYNQIQTDNQRQAFVEHFSRALDKGHHPLSEISTNRTLRPIWFMLHNFTQKGQIDLAMLQRVDKYPQSADHEVVNLRYPFIENDTWRAPSALTAAEWETTLGAWEPQRDAVAKMVHQVELRIRALRTP